MEISNQNKLEEKITSDVVFPKIRTKLGLSADDFRDQILNNFPEVIAPLNFRAEDEIVPSTILGIDGTILDLKAENKENSRSSVGAAVSPGLINSRPDYLEFSKSKIIKSKSREEDMLHMKDLEYEIFNEISENLKLDEIVMVDGPIWSILEDIPKMLILKENIYQILNIDKLKKYEENIKTKPHLYIVKDFESQDLKEIFKFLDDDINELAYKRVADALLRENETFLEQLHPNKKLSSYGFLESKLGESDGIKDIYNRILSYTRKHCKSEILKLGTNRSCIKIQYFDNEIFRQNKEKIINGLEVEMNGIQKEPYCLRFSEYTLILLSSLFLMAIHSQISIAEGRDSPLL